MIEVRELRIGNLSKSKRGEILSFIGRTPINQNLYWTNESGSIIDNNEINPISITEEWLVRFGFKKTPVNTEFSLYYLSSFNYRIEFHKGGEVWFDDLRYLQYVHQLQNLYFALTGEELKLNDK